MNTAERWQELADRYMTGTLPSFEEWWEATFGQPVIEDQPEPGRDD